MSDPRKKLCVVFDIDETLIQFVQKKYRNLWEELDPTIKRKFFSIEHPSGSVILLRPNIRELFNYFKETHEIKVGLWTYSEREYSEDIANILKQALDLPDDFFMFTWGAEDMGEEPDYSKDLNNVYNEFPDFNKFNTFLVDDLYGNLKHDVNVKNGILVQPFAPFGTSKVRVNIGAEKQTIISNDTVFNNLIDVCQKVLSDINDCDSEDIDYAFTTESVFEEKRVVRMGLKPFLKTYAVKFSKMMTIGNPLEVKDFFIVNPDNYQVHVKGGGKTKRKINKNKKRKTRRTAKKSNKKTKHRRGH